MLKNNVNVVTPESMGLTEDEYNNFLIEMMELLRNYQPDYSKPQAIVSEPPVTVTFTPKHLNNYLDIGEQNN